MIAIHLHRHGFDARISVDFREAGMKAADRLLAWCEVARERRRLAALDDRMLKDIGRSRCDALAEADKPFWR